MAFAAALSKSAIAIQPSLWYPLVHVAPLIRISVYKPLESVDTHTWRDPFYAGEPDGRACRGDAWHRCAVGTHAEGLANDG